MTERVAWAIEARNEASKWNWFTMEVYAMGDQDTARYHLQRYIKHYGKGNLRIWKYIPEKREGVHYV
jgi:hypothetical protein